MKKYFFSFLALSLAIGLSAFTGKGSATKHAGSQQSFWYIGTTSAGQAIENNYTDSEVPGCSEGNLRCEILATPDPLDNTKPDLTQPVTEVSFKN